MDAEGLMEDIRKLCASRHKNNRARKPEKNRIRSALDPPRAAGSSAVAQALGAPQT